MTTKKTSDAIDIVNDRIVDYLIDWADKSARDLVANACQQAIVAWNFSGSDLSIDKVRSFLTEDQIAQIKELFDAGASLSQEGKTGPRAKPSHLSPRPAIAPQVSPHLPFGVPAPITKKKKA